MRLYDEREIGAILKRTAELAKTTVTSNADGLSLDEIKQLAAEAGLDPNLVIRAASELSTGASQPVKRDIFGGPLSHSTEMDIDVEVDPDTWESMLPVIRAHFKDPGTVQTREGIYEWTAGGEFSSKAHVSLKKTNGGSRMHLFWSETTTAIPFFIPTIMAAIISLPILFEELGLGPEGIPIWVAIVTTSFLLSRFGVISMKKRNVKRLESLGKDLTQIALQHSLSNRATVEKQTPIRDAAERMDAIRTEATDSDTIRAKSSRIEVPDDEYDEPGRARRDTSERDRL